MRSVAGNGRQNLAPGEADLNTASSLGRLTAHVRGDISEAIAELDALVA